MDYHSAPIYGRKYEQFDDRGLFEPIKLACAVDKYFLTKTYSTYVKITSFLTYRTCYIDENGKQSVLVIGLGNGVAANTILLLGNFCSWEIVLGVTKEFAISDAFNIWFSIVFQSVYSGLPKGIEFKYSYFCRPQNNNPGKALILCPENDEYSKKSIRIIEKFR